MKGVTEQRGLSARQKTRKNSRNYRYSLHSIWILMALSLISSSCQTSGQVGAEIKKKATSLATPE